MSAGLILLLIVNIISAINIISIISFEKFATPCTILNQDIPTNCLGFRRYYKNYTTYPIWKKIITKKICQKHINLNISETKPYFFDH